jgi:hypothetical protein
MTLARPRAAEGAGHDQADRGGWSRETKIPCRGDRPLHRDALLGQRKRGAVPKDGSPA